jgi:hypothetical protein
MVECNLPKVEVAGSSPVSRSPPGVRAALAVPINRCCISARHITRLDIVPAPPSTVRGEGATPCFDSWHRFEDFLADMGPCPDNLTLDRINNDGSYEPGNCRWTTWEHQMLNRRSLRGEGHPNAKLTVDDVLSIRLMARYGVTYRSMASVFGVSHANVGYIVRREEWRELVFDDSGQEPARQRGARDGPQLEA